MSVDAYYFLVTFGFYTTLFDVFRFLLMRNSLLSLFPMIYSLWLHV